MLKSALPLSLVEEDLVFDRPAKPREGSANPCEVLLVQSAQHGELARTDSREGGAVEDHGYFSEVVIPFEKGNCSVLSFKERASVHYAMSTLNEVHALGLLSILNDHLFRLSEYRLDEAGHKRKH